MKIPLNIILIDTMNPHICNTIKKCMTWFNQQVFIQLIYNIVSMIIFLSVYKELISQSNHTGNNNITWYLGILDTINKIFNQWCIFKKRWN